jgi:peptide/nickel transport system substrate-binding protein
MSNDTAGLHLLNSFLRGRLNRRDAILRGAALGLGATTLASLANAGTAAAQSPEPTGDLIWGLSSPVPNIIPFGGIALAQWLGKELIYDSLLAWDADLNVIPALAESWDTPDDTTYTFKLREGVKFHDGRDMTSADVVYSFNVALNPPAPGVKVPYLGNVASVEAVDPYNVTIKMSKADPTLSGTLAWTNYTPIVPEGMMDEIEVLSNGIGTGPFRLTEYVQDDYLAFEAFPDFWQPGIPAVKTVTLKVLADEQQRVAALRAGEIHGAEYSSDVANTLASDEIILNSGITSAPQVIQLNTVEDVPWRDARVRKAISLVIDRQQIIDNVFGGKAQVTGAIPPGFGIWPLPEEDVWAAYAVDVDQAKSLMAEAGYADGFEVELQAIATPRTHTQIAEIVQQAVDQINIKAEVVPLDIGIFSDNIGKGTFQWASTARGMRGDPSAHVVDFRSGTANNLVWFGEGWKNDQIDALYDEGLATVDEARRVEIYTEIQRILLDDLPNIYTVVPEKFQAVRNTLQGMYVFYGNTNPALRTATVTDGD